MTRLRQYLHDLLERIGQIEGFTSGGHDEFMSDIKTQEAVIRAFEVIGEIVKRLPQDLLDTHPEIPWRQVTGFRDFLIHNYDRIQLPFIWNTVEVDLAPLRAAVQDMWDKLEDDESENPNDNA
ncbi:MAG: DUF86 domain-containing protein [Anaerolineae bacterium]|nr:DUF86 domain-containing protein [Anaerolineae bacterium]